MMKMVSVYMGSQYYLKQNFVKRGLIIKDKKIKFQRFLLATLSKIFYFLIICDKFH